MRPITHTLLLRLYVFCKKLSRPIPLFVSLFLTPECKVGRRLYQLEHVLRYIFSITGYYEKNLFIAGKTCKFVGCIVLLLKTTIYNTIPYCIPEESVLGGPLLYIKYINDIHTAVRHSSKTQ